MAALRAQKSDTTSSTPSAPEIVKSTYTPVGRVDIAAIRAQARESQPQELKSVEPSYRAPGIAPSQSAPPRVVGPARFGVWRGRGSGPRGTVAPMPVAPARGSFVIGGASKNFATDATGKTPSQLWAERKAKAGGSNVAPAVAPPKFAPPMRESTSVSPPETSVDDQANVLDKPPPGGVAAIRERLAQQSLEERESTGLPISPSRTRPSARPPPSIPRSPIMAPSSPSEPSPPPISLSSKPPPVKSYGSIDDVVAEGAGAEMGSNVGVIAGKALDREEPNEPDVEVRKSEEQLGYTPAEERRHHTWDTHRPTQEELNDGPAEVYAEAEPEPTYDSREKRDDDGDEKLYPAETNTESGKIAVVLFDYDAQEENEINLVEGEIITNIEFIDDVKPSLT